jgi:hypothetical protein
MATKQTRALARIMIAPSVAVLLVWMIVPLALTLWFSFQNYNILRPERQSFAGFDNFIYVYTDPAFWQSITNTLIIEEPELADFASPNDASVRIYGSQGEQLDASPNAEPLGPPVPGVRDVGEMRVITVALRSRQTSRIAGYVQYGRNEQHIDSTVGRLWLLIAVGVLGATLLASLAGVAIARRAMRPIASLTATARTSFVCP